jgi:hypothetical protein
MRSSAQVSGARARNHEVDASGNRLLEPQPESQEFFQNDPQNPKKNQPFLMRNWRAIIIFLRKWEAERKLLEPGPEIMKAMLLKTDSGAKTRKWGNLPKWPSKSKKKQPFLMRNWRAIIIFLRKWEAERRREHICE